jgi:hypothetical protein
MRSRDRWHVAPIRQTNWRQQCSTCGKAMTPRTWTYCSKVCEISRHSFGDPELPEDVLEEILDAQIAIENASRREAQALKTQMRQRIDAAYDEAARGRRESRHRHPMVEALSPSSREFWESVLGEQFDRYRSSRVNFVRDFVKFASISLEAHTFHGIEAAEVVDTDLTAQDFEDVYLSGAVRKLCKLLPREEASILALLDLSDDAISEAVSEGHIGPSSTLEFVRDYVEANRER